MKTETNAVIRTVAVVDIGATSIRMAIAEIDDQGASRTLERLSQPVNLGTDTFTADQISKETIEECVQVLSSYRKLIEEYDISDPNQIRVVATSAVREARNRLAFQDRIYIATGFEVETLDEAEVTRVAYMGIEPFFRTEPWLAAARTLVVEVGGGSTEVLIVEANKIIYSHTYRLGSLRLQQTLETFRAPAESARAFLESQIQQTMSQLREYAPENGAVEMIALGGDMRFVAAQLVPDWNPVDLASVGRVELESLLEQLTAISQDEIVQRYQMSFQKAETMAPALMVYLELARMFDLRKIHVTNTNLRDGLLKEMAAGQAWTEEFSNQIIRSAVDLGRRFAIDERHARHVAELSRMLFNQLSDEHQLEAQYETVLYVAALLHEIGLYVGQRAYHKHSRYLISNSEVFGLGQRDLTLVALVARYHRRSSPQSGHEGFATLNREHRIAVSKMSALLRVAVALDQSRSQRIHNFVCEREKGRLTINVPQTDDLSLEQVALEQSGSLFAEVFGMDVLLRKKGG
jgi:exopolyphosphatase/guanosine-5'-triphosphate,3'-diphosphate pyrophosphatase